jgi:hypothetical protein
MRLRLEAYAKRISTSGMFPFESVAFALLMRRRGDEKLHALASP